MRMELPREGRRMLRNRTRAVWLALALILAAPALVMAQSFTASLLGNVTDASGAAIPNVKITTTNVANNTKTEAVSDATGRYAVQTLQPGAYRLEATAAGFK